MVAYSRPSESLSISGVLDDGLRLYRVSLRPLFLLSLAISLLTEGQGAVMLMMIDPKQTPAPGDLLANLLPVVLVAIVLVTFLNAAMIARVHQIATGGPGTLAQSLGIAVRRGVPLLIGWLLFGLAVTAGLILLLVPGFYLMVTLAFMSYPLVLDGLGPLASLGMSHELVKGAWWRTATLLTVAFIIATVPYAGVTVIAGILTAPLITPENLIRWTAIQALLSAILYAFVLPMLMCLVYSIYRDLLLRKGGTQRRSIQASPS